MEEYIPYLIIIPVVIFIVYFLYISTDCVICLCARDVEPFLDHIFLNLQKLETLFDKTQIVFFYDKSKDKTLDILYSYKRDKGNIHIIENNEPLLEFRTHRIACARNKLLDYMDTYFNNYEYLIMMDCDDVCSTPIQLDILSKYLYRSDWDSLSFNRKGYYDIWALQYDPFYWDCWGYGKESNKIVDLMRNDIIQELDKLQEGELFSCISAFNGFAIYRKEKFNNVKFNGVRKNNISIKQKNKLLDYFKDNEINTKLYNMTPENTPETCEHIDFHTDAIKKNNARIRISKDYLFI